MCLTPINLKKETVKQQLADTYHMTQVPCGRCIECRKLRVNSWFARLKYELDNCKNAFFITLTYDDDNLPFTENGNNTLDYKDIQKLFKDYREHYVYRAKDSITNRIKRYHDKVPKFKYFAVGEYGEQTHRPHYHIVIFNIDLDILLSKWKKGQYHVGKVEDKSIYYTLKYAFKSITKINKRDEWDDTKIEKALMSKGLGLNYIKNQAFVKYHKEDVSRPYKILGNTSIPLPRYYRDKLFNDLEKKVRNKKLEPYMDKRYEQISRKTFPQVAKKLNADKIYQLKKTD